ncbi:hypothetical protein BH24ACT5_BH24ACT5_30470 [soil metagenome]
MVLYDLQHRCHNSTELSMVSSIRAFTTQHVELVEEQYPRPDIEETEDLLEVPRRLAQV